MKVENVTERVVKEVIKPEVPDFSARNNAPYMKKKHSQKQEESILNTHHTSKKHMTPAEERRFRAETNARFKEMMKDSLTLTGEENQVNINNQKHINDVERTTIASTTLDYSDKKKYNTYSAYNEKNKEEENKSSFSFFNLVLMMCGIFLIVSGFIYIPTGIIWILVGVLLFLYSFSKK